MYEWMHVTRTGEFIWFSFLPLREIKLLPYYLGHWAVRSSRRQGKTRLWSLETKLDHSKVLEGRWLARRRVSSREIHTKEKSKRKTNVETKREEKKKNTGRWKNYEVRWEKRERVVYRTLMALIPSRTSSMRYVYARLFAFFERDPRYLWRNIRAHAIFLRHELFQLGEFFSTRPFSVLPFVFDRVKWKKKRNTDYPEWQERDRVTR